MEYKCEYCGVRIRHYDEGECLDCSHIYREIEKNPAAATKILENINEKNNKKLEMDAKIVCNEDCVAPSKDCYYFKVPGCRWHHSA